MNQENEIARFLVMPFDIMGLKDLNPTDKLVFARIAGFRKFFEASQTTADFLGLSKIQVERSKRKLVKLGYIIELADTGRGKIYRSDDFFCILDRIESSDKNVKPDMTKKSDLIRQKCQTENKKRIKREYKGAEAQNDQEFGRQDINELVELWETETKISIKGDANQRRQIYNLIRKHGHDEAKAIIERVGKMRQAKDRYAPSIMKPSDLVGKYSKLDRLIAWEERQSLKAPQPINTAWRVAPPKREEISDAERAAVAEQFKEARRKLQFLHKDN